MTTDGRPTTTPDPAVAKAVRKAPADPPIYAEAQAADERDPDPKADELLVEQIEEAQDSAT
jgi:hypothetical protein